MKRVKIIVRGDVQGVGFRIATRDRAMKIGIRGWIKNNADGGIEAIFEGEEEIVDDMVDFCRKGPPGSYIHHTYVFDEPFKNEFQTFEIIF